MPKTVENKKEMMKLEERSQKRAIQGVFKSKFLRSILLQTISIFLILIIVVIAVVFFSFTSEINSNIILERRKQLEAIEGDMSQRMDEIASIAYSISNDKEFYLEPVESDKQSGYEMSNTLRRYLVGNDFVEHLAYYRLAEPDTIYVSSGEKSLSDFMTVNMGLSPEAAVETIKRIQSVTYTQMQTITYGDEEAKYMSYAYPLPQFTKNPQAFVLMLIPTAEIKSILETQYSNCFGKVTIFDSTGTEIYSVSNLDGDIHMNLLDAATEKNIVLNGTEYVLQKTTSETNGWTYVSIIRLNDIISESASRQLVFIVLLLAIMLIAIFTMLMCIIVQYKPINTLAMTMKDEGGKSDGSDLIDEEILLSDTFAALKDDSEQKMKFEAAYHEAEAASKAKSAFLSNMSHDIRTPMNAIIGMTEIAVNNSDNPEYVRECLQKVRVSSQYLLDIINNVLDMSRIESGKFTLSEDVIELPKLIGGIITMLNQSLSVKSLRLVVQADDIQNENVIGDSVRLTQVFMNILSNSVKFTPNGGTISLNVSQIENKNKYSAEEYGEYVFVFKDTGIGMSPEFVTKVFDTFTRDETVSVSRIEGTGLGMAIAKNFLEMMGGTIRCESVLGEGTTFTIGLKMRFAEEKTAENLTKYKDMSILIVGEDKQAKLFGELGVNVTHVATAAEAPKGKYDYTIIDQTDEDKSGMAAVTMLRETGLETTYILVARDMFAIEKSAAFNAGIIAFIQAPLFRSTALSILRKSFEKHEHKSKSVVDLTGRRVLLVDDNHINRKIARAQIKRTKAEIIEAENGKDAVNKYKEHESGFFDIILMDVQMPIMNGYEATAAIRSIQRPDASTIPIYAMTANTFDEDVRQVKEAGMNGHIGKPYESSELYKILEQAILKK